MRKAILTLCTLVLVLFGCKHTEYIPIETVRNDTTYISKFSVDTVMVKDSVIIEKRNDTVFNTRWKTEYKVKMLTDTLYKFKTDSVTVTVPVEVVKEKAYIPKVMWWLVGFGLVSIIAWIVWFYKRFI